ncbi:MAG: LLM class flavin-dependent oxidoreductase [Acidimicrobiales bacterium]
MTSLACMLMPEGPVGKVVDVAVEAERLGFERVWIPDEGLAARECYVSLAAVAAATHRVQLGTGITNAYTRHPGVTASAIATLDELSGGRAALGVGAGGGLTLTPMAIDRVKPLSAMRELIETCRRLWGGQTVDGPGITGSFADARMGYGRAEIPVWIAGRGPKVIATAGELADGFIMSYVHKDLIDEHVASLATAAEAAAKPRPKICYMTLVASDDRSFASAKQALTFRLVDSPESVKERIGMTPADTAALRSAIAAGGPPAAAHLVKDEWVEQFVIAGSPAQCRAELETLMAAHGIDEFQVSVNDLDAGADTLAAISDLVS